MDKLLRGEISNSVLENFTVTPYTEILTKMDYSMGLISEKHYNIIMKAVEKEKLKHERE